MKNRLCRVVLPIILLSLLVGLLPGCSEDTWDIGFLGQMNSFVGQSGDKALRDYVDQINAEGGIDGKKVRLITYDSQSEPDQAANLVKRFVEKDDVLGIVGPEWSGGAIPLAAVTNDLHVSVIGTTTTNTAVTIDPETGKLNPWMFRVCFIDDYQGLALADFAYKELGFRRAAVLRDVGDPYATGLSEVFSAHFEKLGGQVVADEGYRSGDVEFRAQLTTIGSRNPDVLLIPDSSYEVPSLVGKQLKDLDIKVQLLGGDGWTNDEILAMGGPELQGSYISSLAAVDDPRYKDYNAAFLAKHGQAPTISSYMALDAFMLIEHALRDGATTREEVRDALENMTNVKVFTADRFTVNPETHNPERPVILLTIDNSAWKLHGAYDPGQ